MNAIDHDNDSAGSEDVAEAFGRRMKSARKAANISQAELGRMIGTDKSQVWRWEAGRNIPEAITAARIARAVGVSADWLILGVGDVEPESESHWAEATQRAVDAFLATGKGERATPEEIARLRSYRFGDFAPDPEDIRALWEQMRIRGD